MKLITFWISLTCGCLFGLVFIETETFSIKKKGNSNVNLLLNKCFSLKNNSPAPFISG